jgi:hypothetical protein
MNILTLKYDDGAFSVTSYGNGTSYAVTRNSDHAEFFLQGDDASQFEEDVLNFVNEEIPALSFEQLIFDHEYSTLFEAQS